jgi:trehalose 6-phosphate synthase/phosphatase
LKLKIGGLTREGQPRSCFSFNPADKIIAIGDDWTDEFLFSILPEEAVTIKVGLSNTLAGYKVENHEEVRAFLKQLACS